MFASYPGELVRAAFVLEARARPVLFSGTLYHLASQDGKQSKSSIFHNFASFSQPCPARFYGTVLGMVHPEVQKYLAERAKRGGEARAEKLSAKRRKEIAIKASRAAAKSRKQKAVAKTKEAKHGS